MTNRCDGSRSTFRLMAKSISFKVCGQCAELANLPLAVAWPSTFTPVTLAWKTNRCKTLTEIF